MLLVEKNKTVFDTQAIQRGDLIFVRYKDDEEGRCGLVDRVTEDNLKILVLSFVDNAVNFANIPAKEAGDGMWEIIWTRDFENIYKESGAYA